MIKSYLTDSRRDGEYPTGDILWTSGSKSALVTFTSDSMGRRLGFKLDVRSVPCTDRENYPATRSCGEPVQEVMVAAGEVLEGFIVHPLGPFGRYPDDVCKEWSIITDDNKVQIYCVSKQIDIPSYLSIQILILLLCCVLLFNQINCMVKFNFGNLFQCIVITVGDFGFHTEEGHDFVTFKDSNSESGM